MKTGILTFVRTNNYGATLQAYALQSSLEKLGVNAELINYKGVMYDKQASVSFVSKINTYAKNFLIALSGGFRRVKTFKQRYLHLTSEYNAESIVETNNLYDKFIVGSDQVWNMGLVKRDSRFLLDFVKDDAKKNSYAASIGANRIEDCDKEMMSACLKKFGGIITVRENTAKVLLKDELGVNSDVVLDPTLLLDRHEWSKVAVMPKTKGKYILIYQMGRSKSLIKAATEDAKRSGLKLISLKPSLDNWIKGRNCYGAGPAEFVGLVLGAEKVYTNSFHGTAFSLNFNKDVHVELLKKGNVNCRMKEIMDNCGLTFRLMGTDSYDAQKTIDYQEVNDYLERERKNSMTYLQKIAEIQE